MPRSGSTMLCSLLNQNPRFYASSTSCLAQTVRSVSALWSRAPEIKSDLLHDKDAAEARMGRATRGLIEGWYADEADRVVFDKGRLWNYNALLLRHLFPTATLIVCVRDLRNIFASIERHHETNPILDEASVPRERTVYTRADTMFGPEGLVGQPIVGVEDLLRRRLPFVEVVQFESLVANPRLAMDRIYAAIGEEPYDHDYDRVASTATDADALYLNKYPHHYADGPVRDPGDPWRQTVPSDIAQLLIDRFPAYNRAFGYR